MRTKQCGSIGVMAALLAALQFGGAFWVAPAQGANLGVEAIEETLPIFDGRTMRDPQPGDAFPPMRLLLSRSRYWAQDGHLDVVVQLDDPAPEGELHVRIAGADGRRLSRFTISPLPGPRFVFYPAIPAALAGGGEGVLQAVWTKGRERLAGDSQTFRVEVFDEPAPKSGRVRLRVPNDAGATQRAVPVTVGVPFPRGVLADAEHLRLVDGAGEEVPLQAKETARWSKFGTVKWVLCDFAADLRGEPAEFALEYGPEVRRSEGATLRAEPAEGFPAIDAGPLRFGRGLWYDAAGDGNYVQVLGERALAGAFVEHEDGRLFRMPADAAWEAEESGPEKVVLKREGWYQEVDGDGEFCQFIVRCVIHRGSPFVRIFHTWIFTGDGNRDRISNMGWEFDLADGLAPGGFLTAFGEEGRWAEADHLLQWDYEHYDIVSGGERDERPGGRAPGVAAATGNGTRLYFGTRDFWQNYPSELEFADGSLWFHNWPRHNRPAGYTFEGEKTMDTGPALPSAARHQHYEPGKLKRSEWKLNLLQTRFAHEGEVLNFRLPDAASGDPVWTRTVLTQPPPTYDWIKHEPESINAQGVSRTEEMWLFLTPEEGRGGTPERVLEGLNDETLRAVADPAWVARSGAFYEIRHQDWEQFPEDERLFEQLALAPARWQEQHGMYGMWLFGDFFVWARVSLDDRLPSLYRALRKGHHGWPYSWIPFARSGDTRLLRTAIAAARQNIDANYTHYVGEDVRREMEATFPPRTRRKGLWNVGPIPWAGQRHTQTRSMHNKVDWLLHAWYLTGYHRAMDNLLCWAEQAKREEPMSRRGPLATRDRNSIAMLQSSVETYEATFDPWFLVAAHAIAEGHRTLHEAGQFDGHFYQSGDREFLRFSGDPEFERYFLAYADAWDGHNSPWKTWAIVGAPMVEASASAWQITGEERFLRRVSHFLDWMRVAVWDGEEPEFARGLYARDGGEGPPVFTSWALQYFPLALNVLDKAGRRPDPLSDAFEIAAQNPTFAVKKQDGQPLSLRLREYQRRARRPHERTAQYELAAPDGTTTAGEWQTLDEMLVEIPADAPAGVYRLHVRGTQRIVVPVVEQPDVPEVLLFAPGEEVVLGRTNNQLWFRVPEGVEQFTVEIPLRRGMAIRRITVWGPDGERAWHLNYHRATYKGDDPVRAEIPVFPGQAGRLWRITLPDSIPPRFTMDSKIPSVYSVCRARWFHPDK